MFRKTYKLGETAAETRQNIAEWEEAKTKREVSSNLMKFSLRKLTLESC